jgi:hypothetical protein
MATNAYKYDPLDKVADEVRLVTIKAGKVTNMRLEQTFI